MRRVVLSKRLQMLGSMVTVGSRAADVGCDHAFLSIWLVQAGVSPRVIAMDVRRGPLAAAREHIESCGLEDYIETRLSDGLQGCSPEEVDTVICAGMGGRLMERILREGMDRVRAARELILQPQSELREFRAFLRGESLVVEREEAVCEEGKYYFALRAVPGERLRTDLQDSPGQAVAFSGRVPGRMAGTQAKEGDWAREQRVYDRFGEDLISQGNPVLRQFLQERLEKLGRLAAFLKGGKEQSARQKERLSELLLELGDVEYALGRMKEKPPRE